MDPLSIVNAANVGLTALYKLWDAMDRYKTNKKECERLYQHATATLGFVKTQCKDVVSETLAQRLLNLANTVIDLTCTIQELKKSSFLKQVLFSAQVSSKIQMVYASIDRAMAEARFGMQLDLTERQRENEKARRVDEQETQRLLGEVVQNEDAVLRELREHKIQMREAIVSIQKNLRQIPESQRPLLERSMHAIQRRSNDSFDPNFDSQHLITSLDIVILYHRKLGQGGFAEVYEANWNGARVAVKVFPKGIAKEALQREFDIWKRLRHPHILQFYGACAIADSPFFVCQLMINGDALAFLSRNPNANRAKLLHDASLGLTYLHQERVIHGDLKGSNILIDEEGRACLADFGLSAVKVTSTMGTPSGGKPKFGTARWMSPETMMEGKTSSRSDIYSFGMTIYEIYTGDPPFANTPDGMLLQVICQHGVRPPRPTVERAPTLTDAMWRLITQLWVHDDRQRPQAQDVASRLEALSAQPVRNPVSWANVEAGSVPLVYSNDPRARVTRANTVGTMHPERPQPASDADVRKIFPMPVASIPRSRSFYTLAEPVSWGQPPQASTLARAYTPRAVQRPLAQSVPAAAPSIPIGHVPDGYAPAAYISLPHLNAEPVVAELPASSEPRRKKPKSKRSLSRLQTQKETTTSPDSRPPTPPYPRNHRTKSTHSEPRRIASMTIGDEPSPCVSRVRLGYWNRRGDHLVHIDEAASQTTGTKQGVYIVRAPDHLSYPEELAAYPKPNKGWKNHNGQVISHSSSYVQLPDSMSLGGYPPLRPYGSFVSYTFV